MELKNAGNDTRNFIGPFLPVIGGLIWGGLFYLYFKWLGMDSLAPVSTHASQTTGHLATLNDATWQRGKLLFGTASFALCLVLLWNMVVSYLIMRQQLRGYSPKTSNITGAIMLFFYVVARAFLYWNNAGGEAANTLLQNLAKTGAPVLEITGVANVFAASTIIFIIGSLTTLLLPRKSEKLRETGVCIQSYALSIYSTGVLLGVAIFEIFSLFSWAATANPSKNASILALAKALPLCAGIVFSLLMVLIYLPVALRQHRWLKDLFAAAVKEPPDIGLDEWLKQKGLPASPLNIFGSYVAMLLPLGTGIITKLLGG